MTTDDDKRAARTFAYEYACEHSETLSKATMVDGLEAAVLHGILHERKRNDGEIAQWKASSDAWEKADRERMEQVIGALQQIAKLKAELLDYMDKHCKCCRRSNFEINRDIKARQAFGE
jgi:hypothetical protein